MTSHTPAPRFTGVRAAALAAALLSATLLPTAPAHAQDLPPADQLVARYQAAIGGRTALEGRTSMYTVGQLSMAAAGISGQFEAWSARPNRYAMRVTIPGFGEIRSGYTGAVGWSLNPMEGPRVLSEAEAAQTADDADFDSSLRLGNRIASMTTVERTSMGGRECFRVRVEWESGRESFDCYSPETGLLVGTVSTQVSNMGTMEATTLYDEYREFNGFSMPTRVTIQAAGMEQVVTISDVTFDSVEDSVFDVPAEVKPLVGG